MAKTLIGNIKGKDGRGIASISKTGTTGSVDTYTIKYTDGTTSTYTVNNSDSIALQRQIVPSAAVESSTTASQAYSAGDYVVVNGILRKVKSAISKGNAISDSNSTATTVGGELATIGDSVSQVTSKTGDAWHDVIAGAVQYRYIAPGTCLLHVKNITLTGGKLRTVGQLPTAYRPSVDRIGIVSEGKYVGLLYVRSGGNVDLYSVNSGDYSGFVVY